MPNKIYAIVSVVAVSLVSLVGIATLRVSEKKLQRAVFFLVSLAVGAFLGDSFFHIIPESFETSCPKENTSIYILLGIFIFFILEKVIHWHHRHNVEQMKIKPVGYMNLVADGVHNLIDGVLIGTTYLVDLRIGIATTIAVILHEIPQEIGDFGVLLYSGFSRWKALGFNFLSSMLAIAGTLVALFVGGQIESLEDVMLPITAGGFIYIAMSDLVPELHKDSDWASSIIQLVGIAIGVGFMMILASR